MNFRCYSVPMPTVVGHRGAASYAPENTLASFAEAKKRGARWVEFDVKLTRDNVPVVLHDDNLRRTTGLDRPAAETDWQALRGLSAGAWFAPRFADARVPSLAETIALLARLRLGANIEIKPCPGREAETARAVVALLDASWPRDQPIPLLSSFKDQALAAARAAGPRWPRALIVGRVGPTWLSRLRAAGATTLNVDGWRLQAHQAARIKAAGLGLGVWTIDEPAQARKLRAWGADCVITDAPDVIARAIA